MLHLAVLFCHARAVVEWVEGRLGKGGAIYVRTRDVYGIPPVLGLLVTAQFVQPAEFLAALCGVSQERKLEARGSDDGVHGSVVSFKGFARRGSLVADGCDALLPLWELWCWYLYLKQYWCILVFSLR